MDTKDISSKPSRLDVQLALDEASRPNADIDDPDEIPEVTTSRKRKASSESAVSESNKKHKSVSGTSSTSSSSSSSGVKKDVKAEDKKATAKASSAKAGSPKSSGVKKGPVVKLLDTSHITTSGKGWHQSTKDEVDMAARNSSAKAAKAKAKTGTAAAKKAAKTKTHKWFFKRIARAEAPKTGWKSKRFVKRIGRKKQKRCREGLA